MCTCITYENSSFYFGRNLDLDCSFGERVMITPRNFPLTFRHAEAQKRHYAMIGMAAQAEKFPLYADAVNEKGLAMAGLNFPGNAFYPEARGSGLEVASFEIIAWILGKCASVANSHFLRTAGPYFPDSPGHIKRTAWDISRAEGTPPH